MLKLKTEFGPNLKSQPVNRSEFISALDKEIISLVDFDLSKFDPELAREFASRAGILGHYLSLVERFDESHRWLDLCLDICKQADLGLKTTCANLMRKADVYRYESKFTEAEKIFFEVKSITQSNPEFSNWVDFVYQHIGKLYFDQHNWTLALEYFRMAHELRLVKNETELIESSRLAISVTEAKMKNEKS